MRVMCGTMFSRCLLPGYPGDRLKEPVLELEDKGQATIPSGFLLGFSGYAIAQERKSFSTNLEQREGNGHGANQV